MRITWPWRVLPTTMLRNHETIVITAACLESIYTDISDVQSLFGQRQKNNIKSTVISVTHQLINNCFSETLFAIISVLIVVLSEGRAQVCPFLFNNSLSRTDRAFACQHVHVCVFRLYLDAPPHVFSDVDTSMNNPSVRLSR